MQRKTLANILCIIPIAGVLWSIYMIFVVTFGSFSTSSKTKVCLMDREYVACTECEMSNALVHNTVGVIVPSFDSEDTLKRWVDATCFLNLRTKLDSIESAHRSQKALMGPSEREILLLAIISKLSKIGVK